MTFHSPLHAEAATSHGDFSTNGSYQSPVLRPQHGGDNMQSSKGNTARRLSGDRRNISSRVSTRDFSDWLATQGRRYSEKELADITGMSIKAAQNIRAGKSGGNGATLATWMLNDPSFAAAMAEYVGLIRPGEAEFIGAFTNAVNAYQRKQGRE